MKKALIIIAGVILVLVLAYLIGTGFIMNTSAGVEDFSVSADGKEIDIRFGVMSSMGYLRKVTVRRQEDGTLYLDAWSAFGGLNGRIGALTAPVTFPLTEDTERIALCRDEGRYEVVLRKDASGSWQRVTR